MEKISIFRKAVDFVLKENNIAMAAAALEKLENSVSPVPVSLSLPRIKIPDSVKLSHQCMSDYNAVFIEKRHCILHILRMN